MIIDRLDDVTPKVLDVMNRTRDPRLREIMVSLVTHLHAFARDVKLTEEEFRAATKILNTMGQQTNDSHNEFVLMAGSLGLSTLICLMNNGDSGQAETSASLLGPFWRMGSPETENGGSIVRSETPGPRLYCDFTFRDTNGDPVEGADVHIWHASPVGLYENQDEEMADHNLRGLFRTDADGRIWFRSVKPVGYPIPTHTTVGRLLDQQGRHPYRPAHVHALAYREGYKTLISQIYVDQTDLIDSDVQFGVTSHLIGDLVKGEGPHPEDGDVGEWWSLSYDLTMEPGEAKLPTPPIK